MIKRVIKPLQTIADIERCMAHIMMRNDYLPILAEYHRLLTIIGNVDGDEIVPLVWVAILEIKKVQS